MCRGNVAADWKEQFHEQEVFDYSRDSYGPGGWSGDIGFSATSWPPRWLDAEAHDQTTEPDRCSTDADQGHYGGRKTQDSTPDAATAPEPAGAECQHQRNI